MMARAAVAGLLVALASLIREVAPLIVPVLFVYLLWVRAGWRALLAFIVAAAIPLVAYSSLIDQKYGVFGLTATSGWTLYGRAGSFADCRGIKLPAVEQRLCQTSAQRARQPAAPDWYIWANASPARRVFHPDTEPRSAVATTNHALESFARTMIIHHPLAFLNASLSDFLRYFTPDAVPYRDAESATTLPRSAADEAHSPTTQRRDLPGLRLIVTSPAAQVRAYRRIVHVPRPVLALLAIAAILAVCVRVPARREVFLLAGTALFLLLGTAATGGFALRYLIPAVPPLAIGGALALSQLFDGVWLRRHRGAVRLHDYLSTARASSGSS